jgi:hypothetical protein
VAETLAAAFATTLSAAIFRSLESWREKIRVSFAEKSAALRDANALLARQSTEDNWLG